MSYIDSINKITEVIKDTKELTQDKFIELDVQLMDIQFAESSTYFEELREVLSNIKIVEEELEQPVDPEKEEIERLNKLKVQELRDILEKANIDYKGMNKATLIETIIKNNLT